MLKSLKQFKGGWLNKSPLEKLIFLQESVSFLLKLLGARYLSDLKIYWLSHLPLAFLIYYISFAIYTVQYYIARGDVMTGIIPICAIGLVVAVTINMPLFYYY